MDLIASFQDGSLLVYESRACESGYIGSGTPVRVAGLRQIKQVISLDTDYSQYGLVTPLNECRVSGNLLFVVMRRGDLASMDITSGTVLSGIAAIGKLSGITSGIGYLAECLSGVAKISGIVTVKTTVLGW